MPAKDSPSITCPKCGRTSYNHGDIEHGYCAGCHEFTGHRRPLYFTVHGLPLIDAGLDRLEYHSGDGQWRAFTGLLLKPGQTVMEAVEELIGPAGACRPIDKPT